MSSVRKTTTPGDNAPRSGSSNSNASEEFNQMISALKNLEKDGEIPSFRSCTPRNVLLVGRTRTGKSTVCKVLEDVLYLPQSTGLFAETRKISFNHLTGEYHQRSYHFNLIDSPGLFDLRMNVEEQLSNIKIGEFINDCIVKDVTDINVFAFVFSGKAGINSEDIKSMIFVKNRYPTLRRYFLLLVTHCEEKNAEERKIFIEQFFRHPEVINHQLKEFFALGVFFLGCLRPELRRQPNTNAALDQMKNVLEMRRTLIEFLAGQEEKFNIHYLAPARTPVNPSSYNGRMFLLIGVFIVWAIFFVFLCIS